MKQSGRGFPNLGLRNSHSRLQGLWLLGCAQISLAITAFTAAEIIILNNSLITFFPHEVLCCSLVHLTQKPQALSGALHRDDLISSWS